MTPEMSVCGAVVLLLALLGLYVAFRVWYERMR